MLPSFNPTKIRPTKNSWDFWGCVTANILVLIMHFCCRESKPSSSERLFIYLLIHWRTLGAVTSILVWVLPLNTGFSPKKPLGARLPQRRISSAAWYPGNTPEQGKGTELCGGPWHFSGDWALLRLIPAYITFLFSAFFSSTQEDFSYRPHPSFLERTIAGTPRQWIYPAVTAKHWSLITICMCFVSTVISLRVITLHTKPDWCLFTFHLATASITVTDERRKTNKSVTV